MDQSDGTREWTQPAAGIWACDSCGRRIQLISDSDDPPVQPFICVCGAAMEPVAEHETVGSEPATSLGTGGASVDR